MGVRLPVEMDAPRAGGSGLGGRGCATAEAKGRESRGDVNRDGGDREASGRSHRDTGPQTPEAYASLVSLVMAF